MPVYMILCYFFCHRYCSNYQFMLRNHEEVQFMRRSSWVDYGKDLCFQVASVQSFIDPHCWSLILASLLRSIISCHRHCCSHFSLHCALSSLIIREVATARKARLRPLNQENSCPYPSTLHEMRLGVRVKK